MNAIASTWQHVYGARAHAPYLYKKSSTSHYCAHMAHTRFTFRVMALVSLRRWRQRAKHINFSRMSIAKDSAVVCLTIAAKRTTMFALWTMHANGKLNLTPINFLVVYIQFFVHFTCSRIKSVAHVFVQEHTHTHPNARYKAYHIRDATFKNGMQLSHKHHAH